jgi:bifunctional DNA-binding transcriptional regulator/antitoxin component of YhaV-PrlF toxin-antitoxin module
MGYSRDEQETVLVYSDGEWNVYSTVPKHIRKFLEIAEMEILEYEDNRPIAIKGKLSERNISIKKERNLSEEQRRKIAERLLQGRKS